MLQSFQNTHLKGKTYCQIYISTLYQPLRLPIYQAYNLYHPTYLHSFQPIYQLTFQPSTNLSAYSTTNHTSQLLGLNRNRIISAETKNLPGSRFRFRFPVKRFQKLLVTGQVPGFKIFLDSWLTRNLRPQLLVYPRSS